MSGFDWLLGLTVFGHVMGQFLLGWLQISSPSRKILFFLTATASVFQVDFLGRLPSATAIVIELKLCLPSYC